MSLRGSLGGPTIWRINLKSKRQSKLQLCRSACLHTPQPPRTTHPTHRAPVSCMCHMYPTSHTCHICHTCHIHKYHVSHMHSSHCHMHHVLCVPPRHTVSHASRIAHMYTTHRVTYLTYHVSCLLHMSHVSHASHNTCSCVTHHMHYTYHMCITCIVYHRCMSHIV